MRLVLTVLGYLALVAYYAAPALLTALAAHVYLRARRLLSLAELDRRRAHQVLIRAVAMLPRTRREDPRTP